MSKLKSSTREPRKAVVLESSGDWCATNYWLQIGHTKSQLALVTRLGKEFGFKYYPTASSARFLVMMALANLPAIKASLAVFTRYADAEGLALEKVLDARAVESLMAMKGSTAWRKRDGRWFKQGLQGL